MEVFVNIEMTKKYRLPELYSFVINKYEFIVDNEDKNCMLKELRHYWSGREFSFVSDY